MAIVILTRHAQTQFNIEGRITGRGSNPPLTEQGILETHLLAETLANSWGERISLMVSSGMVRTNHTAEIINKKLNINITYNIDLKEIDHGHFEGRIGKEVFEVIDAAPDDEHPAGGESRNDFAQRIKRPICDYLLQEEHEVVLLVTHGRVGQIAHQIFLEQELPHFHNSEFIVLDSSEISGLESMCLMPFYPS